MAPGDPGRQVQLRRHGLAGLADLGGVGVPAGVHHGAGGGDGAVAAERLGQRLGQLEALGLAQAAAAGHQDVGPLDVDVGAALLAARDHLGLVGPGRVLHVDVDHLGVAAAVLVDLERVDAADDDPQIPPVVGDRDLGVLEDRPLGHELAVLGADRGDLHRHPGLLARGQPGADLEAEQAAAEQRVAVAALVDDLGHHVDDGLGQALGALGAEDLRRAVLAQGLAEVVAEIVAADNDGVALTADLLGARGALGHGAQRVLVELALVVQNVGENVSHV